MTKIERYAQRKGLCICPWFFDDIGYDGLYLIFNTTLKYKYFAFDLESEGDMNKDKQLRRNYKKVKKYVDMVCKYKEERKIQYYPKLVLKF